MELVDKFDKRRAPLNKVSERWDDVDGEYRQSMHLWIMNDKGEYLIQKRSNIKKTNPGLWSITGGGVDAGEPSYKTVIREAKEELGIDINVDELYYMLSLRRKRTFVDVYFVKQNIDLKNIVMQEEEVADVKWATLEEIRQMIDDGQFTATANFYLDFLLKIYNEYNADNK